MSVVKAEYDFEAQPNSGEMSIASGELLTVIRSNIEGGWLEGRNSRGSVGLFPETYVVPYTPQLAQPVPPPPPPFHAATTSSTSSFSNARNLDDWGTTFGSNTTPPSTLPQIPSAQNSAADDFDDEWTDDDEEQAVSYLRIHALF
ncbi:unnamed protein product [Caenorhabditis auriculariae]|uniref:SH3 domain-containing protein n=1 Tax=Caenorhabditis auriculariae TaxID=2777116 RepID=A0A8S1HDR4_9PELO|nr:unnamed protein product [Caenorhabditis auriculariae]